jgi:hypothetical protein
MIVLTCHGKSGHAGLSEKERFRACSHDANLGIMPPYPLGCLHIKVKVRAITFADPWQLPLSVESIYVLRCGVTHLEDSSPPCIYPTHGWEGRWSSPGQNRKAVTPPSSLRTGKR